MTLGHTPLSLPPHHHRHPRCLALTSSPQIYSNYSRQGHHSPISAPSARILTVSQKNPSPASANSSNNCGKQRPQECSAPGKHPIWRMAKSHPSPTPKKLCARFAGRSGKSDERISSKSQRTLVMPSPPPPSPARLILFFLSRQTF